MADELKYLNDSYSEVVTVRDGVPIEYGCRGGPRKTEEAVLAERIRALTGHRIRFGEWQELFEYNPLDHESRVALTVEPS